MWCVDSREHRVRMVRGRGEKGVNKGELEVEVVEGVI
jgi:hypothetical protein